MILDRTLASKMDMKPKEKTSSARVEALKVLVTFHKKSIPLNILFDDFQTDLDSKDQRFFKELIYGTIRWQIQLDWILRQFVHGQFYELPIHIQNILRLSIYQLRFLDSIPNYAVVNEGVALTRTFRKIKYSRMVNGVLRNYLRNEKHLQFPSQENDKIEFLSINYSFPEWMVELFLEQYGLEKAKQILDALNQRPKITLRINRNKISIESYLQLLEENQIKFNHSKRLLEFLQLDQSDNNICDLPGYEEGCFSIQDESAGLVSHLAKPNEVSRILDICCAPGGKLSHMAEVFNDSKKLIGIDISKQKLDLVKKNLKRLGNDSVNLIQADSTQLPLSEAEMILVDAPCSGFGVIRKNPDIKLIRKSEDLKNLTNIQLQLLEQSAQLLKKDGKIIYSTCTINKQENENFIVKFLSNHPEFKIEHASNYLSISGIEPEGWIKTTPDTDNLDGSFCVRLKKD